MYPCNCGETLTRSVQENAANRTAAARARALFCERPELFIGLKPVTIEGLAQAIFSQIAASIQFKSDARTHRTPKHCVRNAPETPDPFCESFRSAHASPRRFYGRAPAFASGATLVWNATPYWPGTLLTLPVRGPFPPIWCSQSMGPDPTGQGSNGDVQNDASTQESCRDQTAVPLR